MTESIVLYGFGNNDRSGKIRWLARELGLAVEERTVEFGAQRRPPYTELNPFEQVPTAIFRGRTLVESTAICHVVAEAFDEPRLWIGRGEPGRDAYLYWLALFGENFEGRLVETILSRVGILPPTYGELHEGRMRVKVATAASQLPTDGYLAGGRFTVADILAGYSLRLAVKAGIVERDAVEPYLSRLIARPAAQEAHFFDSLG